MKPTYIAIGYWRSIYEPELPNPSNFIDTNWKPEEKELVIKHLDQGVSISSWMGKSWCRFRCGEVDMGFSCLTDGVYIYPEKLTHYLVVHNIRLPEKFVIHVLNYKTPENFNELGNSYNKSYDWWKNEKGFFQNTETHSFMACTDKQIKRFNSRKTLKK